jgi:hypothetical protein
MIWFGSDRAEALFKFRQYENQQQQEEPVVDIPIPGLPPLEPPLTLEAILQFYLEHRKPSKDERRKAISVWKEFCRFVTAKTVREITANMIHDYRDASWAEYEEKGWLAISIEKGAITFALL